MSNHSRVHWAGSYISLPRARKAKSSASRLPLGAGLAAAAVGLAWLLAPGHQEAPAPAGAEPVLAMPEAAAPRARAEAAPAPSRPRIERSIAPVFAAPASPAAAVLAFAAHAVQWEWPAHLTGSFTRALSTGKRDRLPTDPITIARQTILAWNPNAAAGRRALYHQVLSDGTERDRVDSELAAPPPPQPRHEPLFFDLAGTGIKTSERQVLFGITGTRADDKLKRVNDAESGVGILVFDADRNGVSGGTGLELFGDQTDLNGDGRRDGFSDGFTSLRAFVDRAVREGKLPANTKALGYLDAAALVALERAYGLKMKVGGFNHEAVSLAAAGVSAIAFSDAPAEATHDFDGRGNAMSLQRGALFTRRDGSTGIYADVWLIGK